MVPEDSDLPPPPTERKRAPRGMGYQLIQMRVFVSNAMHPEIQARFVPQGYGPPKIVQGNTLWMDGNQKFDRNLVLEGDSERKTKLLYDKWRTWTRSGRSSWTPAMPRCAPAGICWMPWDWCPGRRRPNPSGIS